MVNNYTIQSVERALSILKCFTAEKKEWGLAELSVKLGLNKSTVFRMISTLQENNFLNLTSDSKYTLGSEMFRLASFINTDSRLKTEAYPFMSWLADIINETVVLVKYGDYRGVCLERIESKQTLKIASHVGNDTHLFQGATGKIISTYLSDADLEKAASIQQSIFGYDVNTDSVRKCRLDIRSKGYIITTSEVDEGVTAIAAPLFDHQGAVVGSISIAGPQFRFMPQNSPQTIDALLESSTKISASLGYKK